MFGRFFSAFAVCVCLCGGCSFHPLFAQGDLQNADIPPTEVIDIEPEPDERISPVVPALGVDTGNANIPPTEVIDIEPEPDEPLPVRPAGVFRSFPGLKAVTAGDPEIIDIPPEDEDDPNLPPVILPDPEPDSPPVNPGGSSSSSGSGGGGTVGLTPEIPAGWSNFSLVAVLGEIVQPLALALAIGLGLVVGVWMCVLVWVWLRRVVRR